MKFLFVGGIAVAALVAVTNARLPQCSDTQGGARDSCCSLDVLSSVCGDESAGDDGIVVSLGDLSPPPPLRRRATRASAAVDDDPVASAADKAGRGEIARVSEQALDVAEHASTGAVVVIALIKNAKTLPVAHQERAVAAPVESVHANASAAVMSDLAALVAGMAANGSANGVVLKASTSRNYRISRRQPRVYVRETQLLFPYEGEISAIFSSRYVFVSFDIKVYSWVKGSLYCVLDLYMFSLPPFSFNAGNCAKPCDALNDCRKYFEICAQSIPGGGAMVGVRGNGFTFALQHIDPVAGPATTVTSFVSAMGYYCGNSPPDSSYFFEIHWRVRANPATGQYDVIIGEGSQVAERSGQLIFTGDHVFLSYY